MTFKIKTTELLEALQKTIRVVPTRSTLPILGCALFEFNEKNFCNWHITWFDHDFV